MPHIVVLDGYDANPGDLSWDELEAIGHVDIYDSTLSEQIIKRSSDADYIVTNKVVIDENHLANLPKLKCICVSATGYNVVDIKSARDRGIDVCNVVGYSTPAVAQHVFSLLLHITNHVALHNDSVHRGEWNAKSGWCYWLKPINELRGRTLGLLGFGNIAKQVAQLGLAFGMTVIAHRNRTENHQDSDVKLVSLKELYANSDVLSLHVPLNRSTEEIINKDSLQLMKINSILINTGRGGLINELDLAEALESGSIAFAALDVLVDEPPRSDCQLLQLDNCIITPHVAWVSQESRIRLINAVVENIKAHITGAPICVVN